MPMPVDALIELLVHAIIIAIILGVCYVVVKFIAARMAAFAEIIWVIFYGICAIVVLVGILLPLLRML